MTGVDGSVRHRSYCRVCLTGCGILVDTVGDEVTRVAGDPEHPVSQGYTCPKGRDLPAFHHSPGRLDDPVQQADGIEIAKGWEPVLSDLASVISQAVDTHGPDSVGIYIGYPASLDSAGRHYATRFMRAVGSKSVYSALTVDMPCKPMIAEYMGGYAGLVPVPDWDGATLGLFAGTNPVVSHGQFTTLPKPRVHLREMASRGALWVIDPRETETSKLATRHLRTRPGSDTALLAHLVREVLRKGADGEYIAEHTRGVDELGRAVEPFTSAFTAEVSGVEEVALAELVSAVRHHGRFAGLTGTGTTMSPSANTIEWLMWALGAVTGSLDRPRGVWFNPGFLHQHDRRPNYPTADGSAQPGPASRPELPRRLGEYPCSALADELETGNIRVLLAFGGNPLTAVPGAGRIASAVQHLDAFAVLDVHESSMTPVATHVLPCTGQLEREDVLHYTDTSQMRVSAQYSDRVVAPSGLRRASWAIFADLATRLGHSITPEGRSVDDVSDRDVLGTLASRGRVPFEELREAESAVVAEAAVFGWVTERVLPDSRWNLAPTPLVAQLETWRAQRGLVAIPHRRGDRVNSQQPIARSSVSDPTVLVHPSDAGVRGIEDGQGVLMRTPTGRVVCRAEVSEHIGPGVVSLPHGDAEVNVNVLIGTTHVDPLSGMAEQSGFLVELEPAETSGAVPS